MSSTAIFSDTSLDAHSWPGHVEQAARLVAVRRALNASGLLETLQQIAPRPAPEAALLAVHSPQLLRALRQMADRGGGRFDSDTYVTADSWQVACMAAGAAMGLVETLLDEQSRNGFALVRPPGHHATGARAMGFCLVNHIAVAARHALDHYGLQRVAIVDYDVHHGNGTQDIFYDEPRVLFCSTHAAPFYPGTGAASEMGDPARAAGSTLNVPLPFGAGDRCYALIFEQLIAPALRRFQPQLILVSAGYDAHWSDPLGPMALSVAGYNALGRTLLELAAELCAGRIGFVLEGGYNLDALGACTVATLQLLLGQQPEPDPLGAAGAPEPEAAVARIATVLRSRHPLFTEA